MKRHENLKLAIVAWVAALFFMGLGFWLQYGVCVPILNSPIGYAMDSTELYFYTVVSLVFIVAMALLAILGLYFFYCEYQIEHGQYIEAVISHIQVGSGDDSTSKSVLFCEWTNNKDNKGYMYKLKGVPTVKAKEIQEKGRVTLRISKADPRLHYFSIE